MPAVMESIEEYFAREARTPKGRKALRAIFSSTRDLVVEQGIEFTSLEAVANSAGLTQAALRHYFPTREELLTAFFVSATRWFRTQVAELLTVSDSSPGTQLERCISWHLEYMELVDTTFWLEASAYWIRHPPPRHTRDEFYRWLLSQYSRLIREMRPGLGSREIRHKAYTLLTLVIGAWITHGRGSAVGGAKGVAEQRQVLIDAAMGIATN